MATQLDARGSTLTVVLLSSSMVLGACAFEAGEPGASGLQSKTQAIHHGHPTTTDTPTVAVQATGTATNCSGVLVRPDVVLTAAHCIQTPNSHQMSVCKAATGTNECAPSTVRTVEDHLISPEYIAITGSFIHDHQTAHDWALLRLTDTLPGPYASIVAPNTPTTSQAEVYSGWLNQQVGKFSNANYSINGAASQRDVFVLRLAKSGFGVDENGNPQQALIHGGDSGGPWFARDATGAYFDQLLGVSSSIEVSTATGLQVGFARSANLFRHSNYINNQIELLGGVGRCTIGPAYNGLTAPSNLNRGAASVCLRKNTGAFEVWVAPMSGSTPWSSVIPTNTMLEGYTKTADYQFDVGYHTGNLVLVLADATRTGVYRVSDGTLLAQATLPNQATLLREYRLGIRNLDGGATGGAEVIFTKVGAGFVYNISNATLVLDPNKTARMAHLDGDETLDYLYADGSADGFRYQVIPTSRVAGGLGISQGDIDMDFADVKIWPFTINARPEDTTTLHTGGFVVVTDGAAKVATLDSAGSYLGRTLIWHPTHTYAQGARAIDLRPAIAYDVVSAGNGPMGRVAGLELELDDGRVLELPYGNNGLVFSAATAGSSNFPNPAYSALPSASTNDGKFLYLGGANLSTYTDPGFSAWINTRPGSTEPLVIDIYDADTDGLFDNSGSSGVCFRLVPAPTPGAEEDDSCHTEYDPDDPETIVNVTCDAAYHSLHESNVTEPLDARWWRFYDSAVHGHSPLAQVSNMRRYRLDIAVAEDCAAVPLAASGLTNAFKIRTNGEVSLESGDFSFIGYDQSGSFYSPDQFTPSIETDFDGRFTYGVEVATSSFISLRNSDADDPDGPDLDFREASASGAHTDIRFSLLDEEGDPMSLSCTHQGSTCGTSTVVEIPSGGYADPSDVVEHRSVSQVSGFLTWDWEGVHSENSVHVSVPQGSPLVHTMVGHGSRSRPTAVMRTSSQWAASNGGEFGLPLCLGGELLPDDRCPAGTTTISTVSEAQAILNTPGTGLSSSLGRELLAAKLNIAWTISGRMDPAAGRVASTVTLLQDLLFQADAQYLGLVAAEARTIELLLTANEGYLSFVYAPQYLSSADGDGDGIADHVDNCPNTDNVNQPDADADGVGDACELRPVIQCVYRADSVNYAAFGYENEGRERRFGRGALNTLVAATSQVQPVLFRAGGADVAFMAQMTGPTASWHLNGSVATATTATPACASWPLGGPSPCTSSQQVIRADGSALTFDASGDFCVMGGDQSDEVRLAAGSSVVFGGAGDDFISVDGVDSIVFAGDGNDTIEAVSGNLVVDAGAGNDIIWGGPGDDDISPGAGVDVVSTGDGHDVVTLNSACDVTPGERLSGGPGDDVLRSALSLARLRALGALVDGFESVELIESLNVQPRCWQELVNGRALLGLDALVLSDRTSVMSGNALGIALSGNYLELGVGSRAGSASAKGNAWLRNYARIDTDLVLGGALTRQQGAVIAGTLREWAPVPIEVADLKQSRSEFSGGPARTITNGANLSLAPGHHGDVRVQAQSQLNLSSGTYSFTSLRFESGTTLNLNAGTGPVVIFVRDAVQLRRIISNSNSLERLVVIYEGAEASTLTSLFLGTFIAPNATVVVESSAQSYKGSMVARRVELRPDVLFDLGGPLP
jgi:hypothetical protein